MTTDDRIDQVVLVSGGVRETLFAQPLIRLLPGAAIFAPRRGLPTLLGLGVPVRAFALDGVREWFHTWRRLRFQPVSMAILPPPVKFDRAMLAYLAAIPRRITLRGPGDWWATERVAAATTHPAEAAWAMVEAAHPEGLRTEGGAPVLDPSNAARTRLDWRLAAAGITPDRRLLLLVPGDGDWVADPARRRKAHWPVECFAILANQLESLPVVLVRGAGDAATVRELTSGIRGATAALDLRELTPDELGAAARRSLAVIGHDGDALHVAAASGAPVLGLLNRDDTGPFGPSGAEIRADDLRSVPVRRVVEQVRERLRVFVYA